MNLGHSGYSLEFFWLFSICFSMSSAFFYIISRIFLSLSVYFIYLCLFLWLCYKAITFCAKYNCDYTSHCSTNIILTYYNWKQKRTTIASEHSAKRKKSVVKERADDPPITLSAMKLQYNIPAACKNEKNWRLCTNLLDESKLNLCRTASLSILLVCC